jgi:hypothetical protein
MKKLLLILLTILNINAAPPPKGELFAWQSSYYSLASSTNKLDGTKRVREWTYVKQEPTIGGDYTYSSKTYNSQGEVTFDIQTSTSFPITFSNCYWTETFLSNVEKFTIMSRINVKNTSSVSKTVMFQMNAIAVNPNNGLSAGNISFSKEYLVKSKESITISPDGNYKDGNWSVKEWIP